MAVRDIRQYFIYRWRYILGYATLGILLAGLLVFAGLYVPGGLTTLEMQSVVRSATISFTDPATMAINSLPYYLLQMGVFELFGVSNFTIKLPSLFLALVSALGFIVLLRRWFKPNVAVLAAMVAVTTGQFLYIAQLGTHSILYIFWPVILLLLGTQVTRVKRLRFLWKILFTIAAALSLYTPLSVYPLFAIILATALHPHLRNAVRRLSKLRLAVCVTLWIILVSPLVYFISQNPQLGLTLIGAPEVWPPDILANLSRLAQQYFMFWQPGTSTLMTPVFGLGSVLIIGLGLYRIVRTADTTRSYLLIIWLLCLIPVLVINPSFTSVMFVPFVLLIAAGLTSLISYWYRLFPFNPYARIAGLVPLIILIAALLATGIDRYIYGYHYDPNTAVNFSRDLHLLPRNTENLVVGEGEQSFYGAVAKYREGLTVTTEPGDVEQFTATRTARQDFEGYEVSRIITTTYSSDSDRLYVYQKTE
jgi:hypothetical protein